MSEELTPLEKVKLAAIDTDNFSDEEVWQMFLDLEFSSTDQIYDIAETIDKHRPAIADTLAKFFGI